MVFTETQNWLGTDLRKKIEVKINGSAWVCCIISGKSSSLPMNLDSPSFSATCEWKSRDPDLTLLLWCGFEWAVLISVQALHSLHKVGTLGCFRKRKCTKWRFHFHLCTSHVEMTAFKHPSRLEEKKVEMGLHLFLSCLFQENGMPPPLRVGKTGKREVKKWKFSFFHQRHALSTSFDIFVVTYRVTNFLPNLFDMLLFCMKKKLNLHFWFSPIFRLCQRVVMAWWHCPVHIFLLARQEKGWNFLLNLEEFLALFIYHPHCDTSQPWRTN